MSVKIGPFEKVLIFLIVGFGITILIIRSSGDIPFLRRDKKFKVIAKKSYGLKPGSKIKMKDIEIGRVERVFLDERNRVVIFFTVKREFKDKVKKDSIATIFSPPLLGTPEIHISCGSLLAKDLPEGSQIPLKEPGEDLITALQEKINPILEKMNSTLENINLITEEIRSGRGTLGRVILQDELYNEIINLAKNSNLLLMNMQKISENIAKASERLPEIVNVADKSLENVEEITESTKTIIGKIESGEGNIGKLVKDDSIYKKTKEIANSTSNVLKKVEKIKISLSGGTEINYQGRRDVLVSKIYAKVSPSKTNSLQIGGAFIGNENKGTKAKPEILFIKALHNKKISLKTGVLEGEVGGGVEYFLNDKMKIGLESRKTSEKNNYDKGLDDFILRGWLGVKLKDSLGVRLGIDNLLDKPGISFGITVEK
jgi:phospholipid/cholesterol/gamma-HCH transport system substrate-binding protein